MSQFVKTFAEVNVNEIIPHEAHSLDGPTILVVSEAPSEPSGMSRSINAARPRHPGCRLYVQKRTMCGKKTVLSFQDPSVVDARDVVAAVRWYSEKHQDVATRSRQWEKAASC
jgi:hypothetical protein